MSAPYLLGRVLENDTARGPFRAMKFLLTLSMASSGITVRPSFN